MTERAPTTSSAAEISPRRPLSGRVSAALCASAVWAAGLLVAGLPSAEGHEGAAHSHSAENLELLPSAPRTGIPLSALGYERAVQERYLAALFEIPGVVGVGLGLLDDRPAILVLVEPGTPKAAIPETLDGVPVKVEISEGGRLLHGGWPDCGGVPCHNQALSLPVEMGNATSSANTCDSGTLGFKACHLDSLTIGYVSANHVAAGAPNAMHTHCFNGPIGMQQMHPGNDEDVNCTPSNPTFTNLIGFLHSYVPVSGTGFNPADAAFVSSPNYYTQWSIRDIGTPSKVAGSAQIGACVKKSGRTTGLTWGVVEGLNMYWENDDDQCFATHPTFAGAIKIRGDFLNDCTTTEFFQFGVKGDSGSAVLDTSNRIVGLLFGSASREYAADIGTVTSLLGLSLDRAQCSKFVELPPVADAFIAEEQPTTNFGSSSVLRIRNTTTGFGRYTFLKFNVPPHGGEVYRVLLSMRIESPVQQVALYDVEGMVWSESTVNWSNWNSSNPTYTFLRNYSNLPSSGWYTFDVTGAVSGAGEVTLGITSQTDVAQQDFYSRNSANPPSLIVYYRAVQ